MLAYLFSALPIFLTPGSLALVLAQVEEAEGATSETIEAAAAQDAADAPTPEAAAQDAADTPSPEEVAEAAEPNAEADPGPSAPAAPNAAAAQLARRAQMGDIHRAFGIATWISLATTLVFGGIQLRDEYGPFAGAQSQTPCGQSDATFGGTTFCGRDVPVPHLVSALVTSALYYTTFTLSFMMPDPLGAADSPGWAGERLRIHKILRWLHFGGMVLSSVFGVVTTNMSQDPSDFGVRQGLAITHFALGVTTYALLSAAALVIIF